MSNIYKKLKFSPEQCGGPVFQLYNVVKMYLKNGQKNIHIYLHGKEAQRDCILTI